MVRSIAPDKMQHTRSSNLHQLHHSAGNDNIDVLKTISAKIRSQRRMLNHQQQEHGNKRDHSPLHNFSGISDKIPKKYQLNKQCLELYMSDNVAGFCGKISQIRIFIHAHSNPTYYILAHDGSEYVLRRRPPNKAYTRLLLADDENKSTVKEEHVFLSQHAIEREYRVLKALYMNESKCGIPVPRPYCLCLDSSVIGSPFFIMKYVRGRIFQNPMLWKLKTAQERAIIYSELSHYLAKLHSIDFRDLGLADFGQVIDKENKQQLEENSMTCWFCDRHLQQWQRFYNRMNVCF